MMEEQSLTDLLENIRAFVKMPPLNPHSYEYRKILLGMLDNAVNKSKKGDYHGEISNDL